MKPPLPVWKPRSSERPVPEIVEALARALDLPGTLAEILVCRGLSDPDEARTFLRPSLGRLLDPARLTDMEGALDLLAQSIQQGSLIALHGDYDADGITATALMAGFLEEVGARYVVFLPERERDGYGLSEHGVRQVAGQGARLLLTLDCGSSDPQVLALALELGMTPVVVDHHPIPGELPGAAAAVINPARPDCGFAGATLAAVGVAFFLVAGLRRRLRELGWWARSGRAEPDLKRCLDLVAIGTVADVVPLVGQNRILVAHGLRELGRSARPGVAALRQVARLQAELSSSDVAFKLAPVLNASGRMGRASCGFDLLHTRDQGQARGLARLLAAQNDERRAIQDRIEAEAIEEIESGKHSGRCVLVLAREGWHPGVVGIVASRLLDRYYLPAVVIALKDGQGKGSARSIEGVDIGEAIRSCGEHILNGGGHAMAAGVTLEAGSVEPFADALAMEVTRQMGSERARPALRYDAQVELEEVHEGLVQGLQSMAPFGKGNAEPLLILRGARLRNRRIYKERHLACRLAAGGTEREAIGFDLAHRAPSEGALVSAAFNARVEQFRGERTLRLRLKDIREEKESQT